MIMRKRMVDRNTTISIWLEDGQLCLRADRAGTVRVTTKQAAELARDVFYCMIMNLRGSRHMDTVDYSIVQCAECGGHFSQRRPDVTRCQVCRARRHIENEDRGAPDPGVMAVTAARVVPDLVKIPRRVTVKRLRADPSAMRAVITELHRRVPDLPTAHEMLAAVGLRDIGELEGIEEPYRLGEIYGSMRKVVDEYRARVVRSA